MSIDADRAPLDPQRLRGQLVEPAGPYAALGVVASTGSTNSDLTAAARAGSPDRTVLIAERQTAGRGRQARTWVSPPGAGIYLSVLLRLEGVPLNRLGWLPLLAGIAVARTVRAFGVDASVKWPNDVLAGPEQRKCCGILGEVVSGGPTPAAVLGIGLNVCHQADELPVGAGGLPATSMALEGATSTDREQVVLRLLTELDDLERPWRAAGGDAMSSGLSAGYEQVCSTIGQRVRVELPPSGALTELHGTATGIDPDGRLVVLAPDARHLVSAGDVVHVRPQP